MSSLACHYLRQVQKRGRKPRLKPHLQREHDPNKDYDGDCSKTATTESQTPLSPQSSFSRTNLGGPQSTFEQSTSDHNLLPPKLQADVKTRLQASHLVLVRLLLDAAPGSSLEAIVDNCVKLFVQNVFPLGPLFHEPNLRLTTLPQLSIIELSI